MKKTISLLLYLIICNSVFTVGHAQQLVLKVNSEKENTKSFLDSVNIDSTFSDFQSLKKETDTILYKLRQIGYLESELKLLKKANDTTFEASYFLGTRFKEVKIFYAEVDFSRKELERFSTEVTDAYFLVPINSIEVILQKLIALKTQNGYAFAKLNLSKIKINDTNLTATLQFVPREKRTIDSLTIKGYEKFPKSFLRYYAGIKKGKIFNREKLLGQNEIINSLGFVKSLKPPEILFRKDSTIVYLYYEKQNNNLFDGIIGFATNEKTQKLEFNGYLNLELNNNLNYGERLRLNYKADGNDQKNFNVQAVLPYLFKSPFGVSAELAIFKRDSTFSTTQQEVRLLYQASPTINGYLGYKAYESSNLLDTSNSLVTVKDFKSAYLLAGGEFKRYQNRKLFPIKSFILIDSEIGKRDFKEATDNQFRLTGTVFNIFNLNFNNSIYLKNTSSILFSTNFLTNELFRFGGINSIRGFSENSIDASLYSVLNTEYRYLLNSDTYIHSIIDFGYFENEVIMLKQKLYSFGFGLGFTTKAGIFKFNVANGNIENQKFQFSNTKIHISLSSRF